MKASLSPSNSMALEEVIARLSEREVVDALLLVGSASKNNLTPASDYDLVIVLSDMPVPLHVGVTTVDHRLTDLLFASVAQIERILALEGPIDEEEWIGRIIHWLQVGSIVFDRFGRLERARRKVQTGQWVLPANEDRIFRIWSGINFNLRHNKCMLASDDPVYRQALDVRMLYSVCETFFGYFHVRGLLWEGEKAAVRYLAANDPEYLDLFNRCLAETDRGRKVELYEQLAALALAPVGGLCSEDATAIGLEPDAECRPDVIEEALEFWERLISGQALSRASSIHYPTSLDHE